MVHGIGLGCGALRITFGLGYPQSGKEFCLELLDLSIRSRLVGGVPPLSCLFRLHLEFLQLYLLLLVDGSQLLLTISLPFNCLLYTSPSPRDRTRSRMPSSA
eukprot:TRINITY_DN3032_c0_g1_i1.p1 TRINITY_DN3032_c0_g1~~TRINITY_DN3032_c0_g1_i1.p1  ORF type:complete len:102 (-),score=30.97 TRINITY_DN3032_c0_g1_i1:24-329(-)